MHCIAIDPWFIVDSTPEQAKLIRQAREVNDYKPHWVVEQVKEVADRFKNPVIACLGLAFKANIDDLRESPAMEIVKKLTRVNGLKMLIVEPNIDKIPSCLDGIGELFELNTAIVKADIILVLVDHKQFSSIDQSILLTKIIIDTRGIFNKQ